MITKFKLPNGNYLVPFALPGDETGKMTEEEAKYAKVFIDGMKRQYPNCRVDIVKWGWKAFKAVVVEGDKALFDFATADLDAAQKREAYERRCIIPDKEEGIKRCPSRVPNPNFNPKIKASKTNPKTLRKSCEGCHYNTFDRESYATRYLEDMALIDENGCEYPYEVEVPMMSEDDRYDIARKDILAFISEKFPDKLEEFTLFLDGYNRKQTAEKLGKDVGNAYYMHKKFKEALYEFLETLWCIDLNRCRR